MLWQAVGVRFSQKYAQLALLNAKTEEVMIYVSTRLSFVQRPGSRRKVAVLLALLFVAGCTQTTRDGATSGGEWWRTWIDGCRLESCAFALAITPVVLPTLALAGAAIANLSEIVDLEGRPSHFADLPQELPPDTKHPEYLEDDPGREKRLAKIIHN